MLGARLRSAPVGGYVFGAIGTLLVLTSLVVPWFSTASFVGYRSDMTPVSAFGFGIRSALYVTGLFALLAALAATVVLGEPARLLAGIGGLAVSMLLVIALGLVNEQIKAGIRMAAERQAELRSGASRDTVYVWGAMEAGPMIAGVGVFCLALAVCRFAWPARPTGGYGGGAIATVLVAIGVPWAYQDAVSDHGVLIREYAFMSFGGIGIWFAVSAAIAIVSLLLAAILERRSWLPATLALPAMIAAMGAVLVADGRAVRVPSYPHGYQAGDIVINTGLPTMWLLAGFVLTVCALVLAIRGRRAAQAGMAPAAVAAPATGWYVADR